MEAARMMDMLGCQDKWSVEQADAEQAYVQSELGGTETWVEIPYEGWPRAWRTKGYKRPCCRLKKALYGHPDSGTMWEDHCHKQLLSVGFTPLPESWQSCYYHPDAPTESSTTKR